MIYLKYCAVGTRVCREGEKVYISIGNITEQHAGSYQCRTSLHGHNPITHQYNDIKLVKPEGSINKHMNLIVFKMKLLIAYVRLHVLDTTNCVIHYNFRFREVRQ